MRVGLACCTASSVTVRSPSASGCAHAAASSSVVSATRASPPAVSAIAVSASSSSATVPPKPRSSSSARLQQHAHVVVGQRRELDDARAAHERRVDLEERVLGRRADEHDDAVLDRVQQRVLLRLAEPVDLVDEQDRALRRQAETVGGRRDGRAQLGDAAGDRADLLEVRLRRARDDARQRRLAGAGRAVEDQREERVRLDRATQPRALADDLSLADELVERPRTHAGSKRRDGGAVVRGAVVEERAHGASVRRAQDLALEEVLVGQAPELPDDVALAVGEHDERAS